MKNPLIEIEAHYYSNGGFLQVLHGWQARKILRKESNIKRNDKNKLSWYVTKYSTLRILSS